MINRSVMKRILIAFIIFILLCSASAVFFVVVTQNGILAKEITLYANNDKAYEVPSDNISLENFLKSSDRLEMKPAQMSEVLYLEVDYILGISMDYRIFFNPLTGAACIEKGLVSDKYYSIDDNFMDSIDSGRYTGADISGLRAASLEKNE